MSTIPEGSPGWSKRALFGGDVDHPRRGAADWLVDALSALVGIALIATVLAVLLGMIGCITCDQQLAAIHAMPAGQARDAAQDQFDAAHPQGCPTPTPTAPPTTTPPTTTPPGTTPPQPPSPSLVIDFARVEYDPASGGPALTTWDAQVEAAELAAHPGDQDSGRMVIPHSIRIEGETLVQAWERVVCVEVIKAGLACGRQTAPGMGDEITVGASGEPGARVQGYHVWSGDDHGGDDAVVTVVRSDNQHWRGHSWTLRQRADAPPGPGPTIPTPPASPPVPTPGAETCETAPLPPLRDLGPHAFQPQGPGSSFYRVDLHPHVEDGAFCAAHGMGLLPDGVSVRTNCPPRQEGHPLRKCLDRRLVGLPPGEGGSLRWENLSGGPADWQPDNPFDHDFPMGDRFKVCSLTTPPVCAEGELP
jgi:hypothetical protein